MKIEPDSEIKINPDDSIETKMLIKNSFNDKSFKFYISANYREDIFLNKTDGEINQHDTVEIQILFRLKDYMTKVPSIKVFFQNKDSSSFKNSFYFVIKLLNKSNLKEAKEILNYSNHLIEESLLSIESNHLIKNKFSESIIFVMCDQSVSEVILPILLIYLAY